MTLADLGPTVGFAYHYTKASTALEHILPAMTLRLGSIADTNDPAECPRPSVAFSAARDTFPDFESAYQRMCAVMEEVHGVIARARVACLSVDERPEGGTVTDLPLREGGSSSGWARDRMWAQYADGHRGMCLLFDREKLVSAFHRALAERGKCLSNEVYYGDDTPRLPAVDLSAATRDAAAYALKYRDDHVYARYFMKRSDWAGEREFRLVLLDDGAPPAAQAFVPIRDALVAVMVGHRFPTAYYPCIEHVCRTENIPAFHFTYSSRSPRPLAVPFDATFWRDAGKSGGGASAS